MRVPSSPLTRSEHETLCSHIAGDENQDGRGHTLFERTFRTGNNNISRFHPTFAHEVPTEVHLHMAGDAAERRPDRHRFEQHVARVGHNRVAGLVNRRAPSRFRSMQTPVAVTWRSKGIVMFISTKEKRHPAALRQGASSHTSPPAHPLFWDWPAVVLPFAV